MRKKLLALLLAVCMAVGMLPTTALAAYGKASDQDTDGQILDATPVEDEEDVVSEQTEESITSQKATAGNDYTQWKQYDTAWNQSEAWPASQ